MTFPNKAALWEGNPIGFSSGDYVWIILVVLILFFLLYAIEDILTKGQEWLKKWIEGHQLAPFKKLTALISILLLLSLLALAYWLSKGRSSP